MLCSRNAVLASSASHFCPLSLSFSFPKADIHFRAIKRHYARIKSAAAAAGFFFARGDKHEKEEEKVE